MHEWDKKFPLRRAAATAPMWISDAFWAAKAAGCLPLAWLLEPGALTAIKQRQKKSKRVKITKYCPGTHYHVMGAKYDTFTQAKAHLEKCEMLYGGFEIVKVDKYFEGD